ncbi:hypothetical protein DL96DRAFT_1638181 [Flagelloscypha sp. PMI_526]|nr:hypothetical protein DL96DRAFT_1638181 [Flagelloscypha sp. PMI_526]
MAENPSTLSLEILERVIDLIDSHSALQACSLTCHQLLPRSRTNLFRVVTLSSPGQISSFANLLVTFPHITPYVLHLGFVDLQAHIYPEERLLSILSNLKGTLRTVSLLQKKFHGLEWAHLPLSLQDAFAGLCTSPVFEGMDCQFYGACTQALAQLPAIRHLDLYSHREIFRKSQANLNAIPLESLRVSFVTYESYSSHSASRRDPVQDFLDQAPLLDLTRLRKLVVDPNISSRLDLIGRAERPEDAEDSDDDDSLGAQEPSTSGPWITALSRAASSTLVELYWEIGALDTSRPAIQLNELLCLQNFHFGFSHEQDRPSCSARCEMLLSFLSTRLPLDPIQNCAFSFLAGDIHDSALPQFIRDISEARHVKIGFLHRGALSHEPTQRYSIVNQAYIELQAIAQSRSEYCDIEVIDPTIPFGSWIELRTWRPYGHVVTDES